MTIAIKSSNLHEWYDLVYEARGKLGYLLNENLESYLILTLDGHIKDTAMLRNIIAIDFLNSANDTGKNRINQLRITGDRCLLIAGLFPERAQGLNLDNNYFIDMGQQAYYTLAVIRQQNKHADLFNDLAAEFIRLTHILLTMRTLN